MRAPRLAGLVGLVDVVAGGGGGDGGEGQREEFVAAEFFPGGPAAV